MVITFTSSAYLRTFFPGDVTVMLSEWGRNKDKLTSDGTCTVGVGGRGIGFSTFWRNRRGLDGSLPFCFVTLIACATRKYPIEFHATNIEFRHISKQQAQFHQNTSWSNIRQKLKMRFRRAKKKLYLLYLSNEQIMLIS